MTASCTWTPDESSAAAAPWVLWRCESWRRSRTGAVAFGDEVQRPLLALGIVAAQILADHAQRQQLHAAEEQDHHHQRRVAAHRIAPQQRLGQYPQTVDEGEG